MTFWQLRCPIHREQEVTCFIIPPVEPNKSELLDPVPSLPAMHNNLHTIPGNFDFEDTFEAPNTEDLLIPSLERSFQRLSLSPVSSLTSSLSSTPSLASIVSEDQDMPQSATTSQLPVIMAATPAHVMLLRGECGSPSFNQKQPNKLGQYFKQLKHLFTPCAINTDDEKKSYVVSYTEAEVVDSLEVLVEYSDANSTYQDFKNRLLELYNQVALRYIISNLDQLISEC